MKGHIRERSPGHWAIVIDLRDPQSGQRKRHSFRDTKREPQIKKAELIAPLFCSCIARIWGPWSISCESRPPARFRRAPPAAIAVDNQIGPHIPAGSYELLRPRSP
jgi:hypothetical protein